MTRLTETAAGTYSSRTPSSRNLFERAKGVEPAGVSYRLRFFEPYPFFVKVSKGAQLIDIDGNVYTDYWGTHMAMILGHAHPNVLDAIKMQAEKGWHSGLEHELEVTHAERIIKHVPSAEMVRYASSGSEANFFAVRLARTYRKKPKIAVFEGCWHGPYDPLHFAVKPPFDMPQCGGITRASQEDTVLVPYNDLDAFLERVKHEELACVILEPVMGAAGMIQADKEFLRGLREYCDRTGTLLIFDEVVTGFRLGLSGAQGYFDVTPDLSVLGKIIGGGLPIGAICGRRDVMEHMDHRKHKGSDYAYHGGTFAANAISLAAGLASIEVLENSPVYEHIDRLGRKAREELTIVFEKNGFPAQVLGVGSLFAIHMTDKRPIKDARSYNLGSPEQSKKMFDHLLNSAILMLTPEMLHGAISYAHTEDDIEHLTSTVDEYIRNHKSTSQ